MINTKSADATVCWFYRLISNLPRRCQCCSVSKVDLECNEIADCEGQFKIPQATMVTFRGKNLDYPDFSKI